MILKKEQDRAVTPAVAVILLVAVAVVLGATITVYFFGFTEKIGGPTAEATFEYAESPVGIEMTAEQIAEDVTVEINGKQVASFDSSDAGQSRLIPTSPGDQLTVISADESRSVLVSRTIDDRDELGDFIAHYTFEEGSGDTLVDRSGNDNDGEITGADWITSSDTGLDFDGSGDQVLVDGVNAPDEVDVEEFTIAVAYKQNPGNNGVNQLIEHEYSGNEWFLETDVSGSTYQMEYTVDFPQQLETGYMYNPGQRRVAVGTYDGNDYDLYMNGNYVDGKSVERSVGMGDMEIGVDSDGGSQYLDGEIYEIRLYYSAFDDDSVESITRVMS